MHPIQLIKVVTFIGGVIWVYNLTMEWIEWSRGMQDVAVIESAVRSMGASGEQTLKQIDKELRAYEETLMLKGLAALGLVLFGLFLKVPRSAVPLSSNKYTGDLDLTSDGYKVFLIEKYNIKPNEVLDGYTLNGQLYETREETLTAAHALHLDSLKTSEGTPKLTGYFILVMLVMLGILVWFIS